MAGGVRKLGTSMVEISADIAPLEARLAEAKRLVEQYEMDVEAAKAQANMSDEDRYQATLRRYAVEAEEKRRAIAAEQERARQVRQTTQAERESVSVTQQKVDGATAFGNALKSATLPVRTLLAGLRSIQSVVFGIVGVFGTLLAAVGLVVAGVGKLKDAIFGSKEQTEELNRKLEESRKTVEAINSEIREQIRLRGELTGQDTSLVSEDEADAAKKRLIEITATLDEVAKKKAIVESAIEIGQARGGSGWRFLLDDLERLQKEFDELSYTQSRAREAIRQANLTAIEKERQAQRAANEEAEKSYDRIQEKVESLLEKVSDISARGKQAASDIAAVENDEREKLAARKQADADREHAARMENIAREHEAMMRAIEEYKAKIVGANTAFGGIRNLEAIPGILEKLVNRI